MRGENAETSEEKENQARDQNLGKSQGRNKCHLPAWGCQGTDLGKLFERGQNYSKILKMGKYLKNWSQIQKWGQI